MWKRVVLLTLVVAVVVFCVVQDRVTADGARRYVRLQREAAATGRAPVTVDEIMRPAITQSVRSGLGWGGGVVLLGLVIGVVVRRR